MTVTNVEKDTENLTLTISATLDATAERAWQLWSDPRQLERWWGPPEYPATVTDHDLAPGGRVSYYMTSPEGEKFHAYFDVVSADPPRAMELQDGFADDSGAPNPDMPNTKIAVTFTEHDGRTLMTIASHFASQEAMQQLLEMGMDEGMVSAMGQIDAILAE